MLLFNTVYCFLFAVKKFRGCKSFPSFPEKYSRLCRSAYYNWPSCNVSAACHLFSFTWRVSISTLSSDLRIKFKPTIKACMCYYLIPSDYFLYSWLVLIFGKVFPIKGETLSDLVTTVSFILFPTSWKNCKYPKRLYKLNSYVARSHP